MTSHNQSVYCMAQWISLFVMSVSMNKPWDKRRKAVLTGLSTLVFLAPTGKCLVINSPLSSQFDFLKVIMLECSCGHLIQLFIHMDGHNMILLRFFWFSTMPNGQAKHKSTISNFLDITLLKKLIKQVTKRSSRLCFCLENAAVEPPGMNSLNVNSYA